MVDLLLTEEVRSLPHRFCDDILDLIVDLAPVQASDGGLFIDRLLEGERPYCSRSCGVCGAALGDGSDAGPPGGEGHGDPLALSAYTGVKTAFLLLRPYLNWRAKYLCSLLSGALL